MIATRRFYQFLALALPAVVAVAVSSCSSPKPSGALKDYSFEQETGTAGFGGEVVTDSITTNATVVFVNPKDRTIGLKYADGSGVTYQAGPDVSNLDQFKVGDQVKATVIEELAVSVVGSGPLPPSPPHVAVVRRPKGLELGNKPVQTLKVTAKILALNLALHQVTLQTTDGQIRTIRARDDINLAALNVGDNVSVVITRAMMIALEKS
jgi:hypothetical protein